MAAWIEPFLIDGTGRDLIKLGVETFPVLFNGQGLELAVQAPGLLPASFAACGHQFEGQKQRPLRLDSFKGGELLWFVVQAVDVFHRRLVTIPEEAFVAIGPAEFPSNPPAGALHQGGIFHGPGGITNH